MTELRSKYEIRTAAVKEAVRAAATTLFAQGGFAATGVREIAAAAGVDAAIVIRHFGSKEGLFLETMQLPEAWTGVTDGPLEGLGERVVRFVASEGRTETSRGVYAALIRASDRPEVRRQLQVVSAAIYVQPLLGRLKGADAELRARLFSSQVGGLMTSLWVTEDPLILRTDIDLLAAWLGPALQTCLTGIRPS